MKIGMNNNKISLTVTMPVYNVEKYLSRGIESVLKQTYRDFELIIVDDGSTDCSGEICDYYASIDNRIKVIHQKNKGLVAAREVALEVANGLYIGFVDPDDWVEEEFFERVIEAMERTNASIGVGGYVLEYENGICKKRFKNNEELILSRDEGLENLFSFELFQWELWDKIYKRDVIKNIMIDREITCGEDLLRVYAAFCRSDKICVVPIYGYHYMQRNDSMTGRKKRKFKNTVFYAMTTIEDEVKQENNIIRKEYIIRRNRFLIIDMVANFYQGEMNLNFIKEIKKQSFNIILGEYPIRFKVAAIFMRLLTMFNRIKST